MKNIPDRNFDALVKPTKIHRSLYTDPELFELEMARIWGQAWVFIGHEHCVVAIMVGVIASMAHCLKYLMSKAMTGPVSTLKTLAIACKHWHRLGAIAASCSQRSRQMHHH